MTKHLTLLLFIGLAWGETANIAIIGITKTGLKNNRPIMTLVSEIEKEIKILNHYSIIPTNQISSIIEKEIPQLDICNIECLKNIGSLINVDLVIIGNLKKTGNSYVLTLELFNVNKEIIQKSITVKSKKGLMKLIAKLKNKIILEMSDTSYFDINSGIISNVIKNNDYHLINSDLTISIDDKIKTNPIQSNQRNSFLKVITDENGDLIGSQNNTNKLITKALKDSIHNAKNSVSRQKQTNLMEVDLEQEPIKTIHLNQQLSTFDKLEKYFGVSGQEQIEKPILTFNYESPPHPIRYDVIDKYSEKIKHRENEPIYALTDRIIKNSENDYEKIRAVYKWITKNIYYDIESLKSNTITHDKVKAINVLKTKKTVCSGYANLFKEMAEYINVPTKIVQGFAKGYGYKPGDLMHETNHAWNAIKLNDNNYLIDCTWGSGYIDKNDRFVKEYREYYFLVKPEYLIWTHLPEESAFQMIEQTITKNEFEILPHVSRSFFENKINFSNNHTVGYIVENELSLDYIINEKTEILCTLTDENDEINYEGTTYISKNGEITSVKVRPPASGNFFLRISSKNKDDSGSYWGSIEYLIKVPENYKENSGFVKIWNDNIEKYQINFNNIHSYRYNISNMLTLDYICSSDIVFMANIKDENKKEIKNHTFLQKSKSGIELLVNVPDQNKYYLNVYAKNKNEKGSYSGIAEYSIIGDKNGKRNVKTFPMQYGIFNVNNGTLISPIDGELKIKQNYNFIIQIDDASEISIIHNDKWTGFEKNNLNQFILTKSFQSKGKVEIAAKFKKNNQFSIILGYIIS